MQRKSTTGISQESPTCVLPLPMTIERPRLQSPKQSQRRSSLDFRQDIPELSRWNIRGPLSRYPPSSNRLGRTDCPWFSLTGLSAIANNPLGKDRIPSLGKDLKGDPFASRIILYVPRTPAEGCSRWTRENFDSESIYTSIKLYFLVLTEKTRLSRLVAACCQSQSADFRGSVFHISNPRSDKVDSLFGIA